MNRIYSHKPSGWPGELWRESLPLGNGLTGALVSGGAGVDHIWLNHYDRWEGSRIPLPDGTEAFRKQRLLVREGRFAEARTLLSDELERRGYKGWDGVGTPMQPVAITVEYDQKTPFKGYERGIDLEKETEYVRFETAGAQQSRRAFVSRRNDCFYYEARLETPLTIKLCRPDSADVGFAYDGCGAQVTEYSEYIKIEGATRFVLVCAFGRMPEVQDFDAALREHLECVKPESASITLSGGDHSNEALLDEAYAGEASPELIGKLWRFGRYLFKAGTAEGGYPFPLYGLWHGMRHAQWAQNVANENVEMIYWHVCPGGMAQLVRPLIHYYYKQMPDARENAKKLFGCRGICVSVYTTPLNGLMMPNVPVIANFIGAAGWLSRHFYEYWRYTRDDELLESEILPFMLEAAQFYEDYAAYDDDGRLCLEPSVSPENTPGNLMPPAGAKPLGHAEPVTRNSVMELAIVKELLRHLLDINGTRALDPVRVQAWQKMLCAMPEYRANEDGAVKEWQDDRLTDNYRHRHLSHIYPLFPGEEVRAGDKSFKMFERAVDLRELGAQSGWSLAHMAAVYVRLGRPDSAFECLNTLCRSCLLNNFFTIHNDWRDMSLTLNSASGAPLQLDALMGVVNAVQEMLLRQDGNTVNVLPACPAQLKRGSYRGLRVPDAEVSCAWDMDAGKADVRIKAVRACAFTVHFPEWCGKADAMVELSGADGTVSL